jgi:GDPmannose 4,6-dehydratase
VANKKRVLITGITGQDGAYLANHLLRDGYKVYGGFRRGSSNKTWRLDHLGITSKVQLVECQINELQNLIEIFKDAQPDEVYHLAGESFVADSFKHPGVTLEANVHGVLNILETIRLIKPDTRLFCASSSEVFGQNKNSEALNEASVTRPKNPYGISKLAALHLVRLYREQHGLPVCSGILFNHESPLRSRSFVPRKITYNLARLKKEGGLPVDLGDLNASRDWGAAEDYTAAMRLMLGLENLEDLVIASGRLTTVRDFFGLAAKVCGFDPVFEGSGVEEFCVDKKSGLKLAQVSKKYFRPHDTHIGKGDPTRVKTLTGWEGTRNLETLVEEMARADIDRWNKGMTNV